MPLEEELDKAKQKVTSAIKIAMLKKGVTQAQLARQLHVHRGTLSRAVNGDNNPQSVQLREVIYKLLDMDGK